MFDGGESMGDDQSGPILKKGIECFLDLGLGEGIHAGGGFIQDEDGRILEEDPGQRDQLPLAHGETDAACAHLGVQPIGEVLDPVAVRDVHGGPQDLRVTFVGQSVADIVPDRAGEQERVPGHDADLVPVLLQRETANVTAVNPECPVWKS